MYLLTGCPISGYELESNVGDKTINNTSNKTPFLTESEPYNTNISSRNEPVPDIDTRIEYLENSNTMEELMKEQIFFSKMILLFLGFLLLSNILNKK